MGYPHTGIPGMPVSYLLCPEAEEGLCRLRSYEEKGYDKARVRPYKYQVYIVLRLHASQTITPTTAGNPWRVLAS